MRARYAVVAAAVAVASVVGGSAAVGRQENGGPEALRMATVARPVAAAARFGLERIALADKKVYGGYRTRGTVYFTKAAGSELRVAIAAPGLKAPRTVKVPKGARSASFWVGTRPTGKKATRTVKASFAKKTLKASLTVLPLPSLSGLALSVPKVTAGGSLTGTVRLSGPAQPGGSRIALSSDVPSVRVPGSVKVREGARTATFRVSSATKGPAGKATITARRGSVERTASVRVLAAPVASPPTAPGPAHPSPSPAPTQTPTQQPTQQPEPAGPKVSGLLVDPGVIATGETGTGTVTLDGPAPAHGTKVTLAVTHGEAYVRIPETVTVPAGQGSADFAVTGVEPADAVHTDVRISASAGGSTEFRLFNVAPPLRLRSFTADKVVYDQMTGYAVLELNGPATPGLSVEVTGDAPLRVESSPVSFGFGTREQTVAFQVGQAFTPGTITRAVPVTLKAAGLGTTLTWGLTAAPGLVSMTADLPGGWDIPDEFTTRVTLGGPANEAMRITTRPAPNDDTLGLVDSPVIPAGATTYEFRMRLTGEYRRVADVILFVAGRKVKFGINFGNVYLI
ncbi:hypothetical protein GCM10022221_39620 [Actinocorallia aurea]